MNTAPATGVVPIDFWQIGLAALLILISGAVSLALRLGLERSLLIASVRTVAQLLLVGYVLRWVFGSGNAWALAAVIVVMITVAGYASTDRTSRKYPGALTDALLTLTLCGLATCYTVTGVIVGHGASGRAQYVIPLLGMILGNALTGVSLFLDSFLESLSERRGEVEMELALGATRWEAAQRPLSAAVRRAMLPTINAMMVVGLVSLPGMMTGQILSGTDPQQAVRYQIIVQFMLAAATAAGCTLMGFLSYRRLFTPRHQLAAERITKR